MRGRVGEQRLLALEHRVLVGVLRAGVADLVDLEAQQVELAGPGTRRRRRAPRAARSHLARVGAGGAVARRAPRARRPTRVPVERGSLHGGVEQRLVRVLAVQVDERGAALGELGRGREPAVDVGAAAPVARARPGASTTSSPSSVDEAPLDPRLGAPVAHQRRRRRVRPTRSSTASTSSVLPAPVSPVIAVRPGPSTRSRSATIPRSTTWSSTSTCAPTGRRGRTWPSGSGGSRGGPNVTMRAGRGPAVQVTASPAASSPSSRPSTVSVDRAVVGHDEAQRLVGAEHERPVEQHVGRHRRQQQAPVARRHDRAPRRERVRGRAGRRRDDHAVGRVGREERAVDLDVEADQAPGVQLLEHGLVERVPATGRRARPTRRRPRAPCARRPS